MIFDYHSDRFSMANFLENFVKIYQCQKNGTVLFGCQGQAMDGYTALHHYNELAKEVIKHFDKNEVSDGD